MLMHMDKAKRPRVSERVERFIKAYVGEARQNATEAARMAGYKAARSIGWQLTHKFRDLIEAELLKTKSTALMSVEEAQKLMSDIARGTLPNPNPSQLKALELALKMHGMLNDKLNISYDRSELSSQLDAALAALANAKKAEAPKTVPAASVDIVVGSSESHSDPQSEKQLAS